MSFVTDFLFGEKQKPIPQSKLIGEFGTAQDQVFGAVPEGGLTTGASTLNPRTGALSIDPLGRNLNLEGLDRFGQELGQQREALLGNKGAFQEARVNPLVEQLAAGRGQLERNIGRTGVRGTIGQNALQNYDIGGQRALGDARALAEQETQTALNQISTQLFEGTTGTGQNIFTQELQGLGLSSQTLTQLISFMQALTTGTAAAAVSSANQAAATNQARANAIRTTIGAGLFPGDSTGLTGGTFP